MLTKTKPRSEHGDQSSFVSLAYFEFPGLIVFAVPNGGYRTQGDARRLKAEGVRAGVPDVYVEEARGGFFGLRIEMKRLDQTRAINGGLSAEQIAIHNQLRGNGYCVVTCYGSTHAMDVLRWYMGLAATKTFA